MLRKILNNEKIFFWFFTALIIFISTIPYLVAIGQTIINHNYYTGVNFIAGFDKTIYLSYMEQAREGGWLMKNLYTSEPQSAKLFFPVWLVLGKIAGLTNLPNLLIFQLVRICLAFIFLYFLYHLIKIFFSQLWQRQLVFVAAIFASGIGIWRFLVLYVAGKINNELIYEKIGTDVWISEANTFLTIVHSGLFILSQIFILMVFWLFIRNLEKFSLNKFLWLSLLSLFLGIFHTYDVIIICGVLGVFSLVYFMVNKKIAWPVIYNYAAVLLFSMISAIFFVIISHQEVAIGGWVAQNEIVSPALWNYFIGYGLIGIFFLFGLYPVVKNAKNHYYLFIVVWALTQIFLLYLPVKFQTKLSNGLHLPLIIIAGIGFFWLIDILKSLKYKFIVKKVSFLRILYIDLLVFFLFTGNFCIILFDIAMSFGKDYPNYIKRDEYQAIINLNNITDKNDVILADRLFGNLIPSIVSRTVYLGHGHQTINFDAKSIMVAWFFNNNHNDQLKEKWLKKENIRYVFYDTLGVKDDNAFKPAEKTYLKLVYQLGDAQIYKVINQ